MATGLYVMMLPIAVGLTLMFAPAVLVLNARARR